MNGFSNVAASDWQQWVDANDAIILDVRQPHEWALGTLPDAVLIPQFELPGRLSELPKDKPILCVCRSGSRSANVANFLVFNDYQAANMTGGMKELGMQT
ncbi:MAG: rhodanese-like domain-containing protein [Acidimicrobiia bacterium]|jgi:rhodanese-related sulfurtransferase